MSCAVNTANLSERFTPGTTLSGIRKLKTYIGELISSPGELIMICRAVIQLDNWMKTKSAPSPPKAK